MNSRHRAWWLALALAAGPLAAQEPLWRQNQFDPKPASGEASAEELLLPMPCGGAMVLRRVEVGGNSGWLGEQKIELGSTGNSNAPVDQLREEHISGTFSGVSQDLSENRYYYIGKYEVTELQWQVMMDRCPEELSGRRPKVDVSWYDAVEFTRRYTEWLYENARGLLPEEDGVPGYLRLPTEVEWEFAARGGMAVNRTDFRKAVFPTESEFIEDYAWIRESVSPTFEPRPIGLLGANPLGLYDILGNAAELTFDLFRLNAHGRLHGQAGGFLVKGGHFRSWQKNVRTAWRQEHPHFNPSTGVANRLDTVGFRVALSAPVLTSGQRLKAIQREWVRLPQEAVRISEAEAQCRDLAVDVRSSLAVMQASLERCLVDAGRIDLPAFPAPPAAWGRVLAPPPPWSTVRDRLPYLQPYEIERYGLAFLNARDPDRALLLFKEAARKGQGWSALAIGAMYDPMLFEAPDFNAQQTPFTKANPGMAMCWYQVAAKLGEPQAGTRIDALEMRQGITDSPSAADEPFIVDCDQIMEQVNSR